MYRIFLKYTQVGLIVSTLLLISACGWFGGGSDEPEAEPTSAAQSETTGSEEASSEDTADDSSNTEESTTSEDVEGESVVTESGLEIIMIEEGDGERPASGDVVEVHYVGTLEDGTQFDSSRDRGQPYSFTLGQGKVIAGWDEGIATLKKGGKAKLIIPPDLGYGARGAGSAIPPNATLHFEVELVDFQQPPSPQTVSATDYIETESGLKYFDFEEGEGEEPESGQIVTVHYTGWLTDGSVFDSSLNSGQPIAFPIGQGAVIPGWDEGLASMKVGGKRQLVIPPELGYGDAGAGNVIPGGATLIFEVELIDIQ